MNRDDEAFAEGEIDKAVGRYRRGAELAPDIAELPFWHAVTLFMAGREDDALAIFRDVFAREESWRRLVPRLPASGLLPDDPEKIERILATGSE